MLGTRARSETDTSMRHPVMLLTAALLSLLLSPFPAAGTRSIVPLHRTSAAEPQCPDCQGAAMSLLSALLSPPMASEAMHQVSCLHDC